MKIKGLLSMTDALWTLLMQHVNGETNTWYASERLGRVASEIERFIHFYCRGGMNWFIRTFLCMQ